MDEVSSVMNQEQDLCQISVPNRGEEVGRAEEERELLVRCMFNAESGNRSGAGAKAAARRTFSSGE